MKELVQVPEERPVNKPNTYSQIYIQVVFAVKGRQNFITEQKREELQKYIAGIIHKRSQKLLAINCLPDHVHLLIGVRPNISISDLVRDIKSGSSHFLTENIRISGKFSWQEGFGAFSYSRSQINHVIRYISNQQDHHKKRSFREEYQDFLKKFEIEFQSRYLFEWYD